MSVVVNLDLMVAMVASVGVTVVQLIFITFGLVRQREILSLFNFKPIVI